MERGILGRMRGNKYEIRNTKFEINSKKLIIKLLFLVFVAGCVVRDGDVVRMGEEITEGTKYTKDTEHFSKIKVEDRDLKVEVVDEADEINLGLGYRDEIGSDGMLFVMPREAIYPFWMKGMRIGLDLVWIDCGTEKQGNRETDKQQECGVVDITEKVSAPEDPEDVDSLEIYQPSEPVTHVLEVDYGKVEEWGVKVGDEVRLEN